jgi:hypothetical protein
MIALINLVLLIFGNKLHIIACAAADKTSFYLLEYIHSRQEAPHFSENRLKESKLSATLHN